MIHPHISSSPRFRRTASAVMAPSACRPEIEAIHGSFKPRFRRPLPQPGARAASPRAPREQKGLPRPRKTRYNFHIG